MASFQPITGAVDNGKSYNMERVLRSNVLNSTYFTQLCKVEDFMDLVDEIYNEVDHVEPWMSGNARGPSTAFCLLYRLFTMELDDRNINHLINHRDSPYIRALGFLYVRYVRDPKEFGRWFDPFFKDDEEFAPMPGGKNVTIGAFVRDLVLDQYYFETIFPRCPEVTRRRLVERVVKLGFDDKPLGCGGCGGSRRAEAPSGKRPPSVKAALSVNLGQRAPHVAGVTERGRGLDPSRRDGHDKDKDRTGQGQGQDRTGTGTGTGTRTGTGIVTGTGTGIVTDTGTGAATWARNGDGAGAGTGPTRTGETKSETGETATAAGTAQSRASRTKGTAAGTGTAGTAGGTERTVAPRSARGGRGETRVFPIRLYSVMTSFVKQNSEPRLHGHRLHLFDHLRLLLRLHRHDVRGDAAVCIPTLSPRIFPARGDVTLSFDDYGADRVAAAVRALA